MRVGRSGSVEAGFHNSVIEKHVYYPSLHYDGITPWLCEHPALASVGFSEPQHNAAVEAKSRVT